MPRKHPGTSPGYVLFDVTYEDGTKSSNRRVPSYLLEGPDAAMSARAELEEQEQKIAQQSGRARPAIKSIAQTKN